MAYKLDIYETLRAIDNRDFGFLDRQEDDAKKGFAPLVVMRWLSGIKSVKDAQLNLLLVNEMANRNFFDIADHPELQYKLMASCGLGYKQDHVWLNMTKQRKGPSKLHDLLHLRWPDANSDELNILLNQFTRESFCEFVEGFAFDQKDTQGFIDAYDRHLGIEPEPKKKKPKGKAKG